MVPAAVTERSGALGRLISHAITISEKSDTREQVLL
jgi:hypothetical protein